MTEKKEDIKGTTEMKEDTDTLMGIDVDMKEMIIRIVKRDILVVAAEEEGVLLLIVDNLCK